MKQKQRIEHEYVFKPEELVRLLGLSGRLITVYGSTRTHNQDVTFVTEEETTVQ